MKKAKSDNKRLKYVLSFVGILVIGFVLGFLVAKTPTHKDNNVKVWTVDKTVKMPKGLEGYLSANSQNDCRGYRGTGSPTGVAIFAIEKSVGDDYARMAYGCSDNLTAPSGIVAVKENNKWQLIQPVEYYANGEAPLCGQLDKYKISKQAEPKCVNDKGRAQDNNNQ